MKNINLGILILILLLISNVFMLLQINEVKEDIERLKGDVNSTRSWVENSVNGIRNSVVNAVNDIEKEKRWITPVEVSLGEKNDNKQQVNLSWQIKDYTEGSQVYFYYRKEGSGAFQKLPAENIVGSTFAVDIELPLELKPEINIRYSYSDKRTNEELVKAEEKRKLQSSYIYEYYVEVHNGDNIRASEQNTLNLSKLKYKEFSRVYVNITYVKTKYSFTVYEETAYGERSNKLEKVSIKGLDGNGNSFKEKFHIKNKDIFTKTVDLENNPRRAELILEYTNGKVITEEISL